MVRKTNYQNALIYKLVCNDVDVKDIYVGSTCNFRGIKWKHKYDHHNTNSKNRNCKVYQYIRANGGFQNWSQILVENFTRRVFHACTFYHPRQEVQAPNDISQIFLERFLAPPLRRPLAWLVRRRGLCK